MARVGANYVPQIDFIRALAIISVILMHSVPYSTQVAAFSEFHIRQGVPIFFIAMGMTLLISFSRRRRAKNEPLYSKSYLVGLSSVLVGENICLETDQK